MATTLHPVFSAVAHGVKRSPHYGFQVIFKMIATPLEFQNGDPALAISEEIWNNFTDAVNTYQFAATVAAGKVTIQVLPEGHLAPDPNDAISFTANPDAEDRDDRYTHFNFGASTTVINQTTPNFANSIKNAYGNLALNPTKRILPLKGPSGPIQLHDNGSDFERAPNHVRQHIEDKLSTAQKYQVNKSEQTLDLKNIYATVLNDPYIAERQFGLIREFAIDLKKFTDVGNDFSYGIAVTGNLDGHTALPDHFVADVYRFFQINNKYYNGFKSPFFKTTDFASVQVSSWDLYKQVLDSDSDTPGQPHPDGLYVNVTYPVNATTKEISDPFAKDWIKGYNAIVHTDQVKPGAFFSLSMHQVDYKFSQAPNPYAPLKTSGTLNPRTEIVTDDGNARNNVLMTWRGDNLSVNRAARDQQPGDGMAVKTSLIPANNCDNHYIHQHMFTRTESLVWGTQAQLRAGINYYIILRVVGPSEHYLPLISEVPNSKQLAYTWTIEDELHTPTLISNAAISGKAEQLAAMEPGQLPIKKIGVIGHKLYNDQNSGMVDNGNHLVLDEINHEHSEQRYLFPPAIKLEDLKILGYFSTDKLKTSRQMQHQQVISQDDFVRRCRQIEQRLSSSAPKLAFSTSKIHYLPDPRGSKLIFFPADLSTLNRLANQQSVDLSKIFVYTDQYPFFDDTRSLRFQIRKHGNKTYQLRLDDKVLFADLSQGIYKFQVFVVDETCDNKAPQLKSYNSEVLQASVLDRPVAPKSAVSTMPVQRVTDPSIQNYWFSQFSVPENDSWQSIKYREQTEILRLDSHRPDQRYRRLKRKKLVPDVPLLCGEFPYEVFLDMDGDVSQPLTLRANIYPFQLNLSLKADLGIYMPAVNFFQLKLNDKDNLAADITTAGLTLRLNNTTITSGVSIKLQIIFNPSNNNYQIQVAGVVAPTPIPNMIKPDLSVKDVVVSNDILAYLQYQPDKVYIKLDRTGDYVFIANLQHAHSANKTIRLFGSSPYQGYYPKASSEFDLGADGSQHSVNIPNNSLPMKPQLTADILLMHTQPEGWEEIQSVKQQQATTQQLIRLSVPADFMTEGRNMLGIVLSGDPAHSSRFGDDITKLSTTDFSGTALKNLLPEIAPLSPLFSKYFADNPYRSYNINGQVCEVLHCVPYYDTERKLWQVLLPLKPFRNAESLFFQFVGLKIAPGYALKINTDGSFTDMNNTVLSIFSDPVTLPVYNTKSFQLTKYTDHYQLVYQGPRSGKKVFFVMLTDWKRSAEVIWSADNLEHHLVPFDIYQQSDQKPTNKILLFTDNQIAITRTSCENIVVLEFEVHDNIDANFSNLLTVAPNFIQQSPLFGQIPGIRLINVAIFNP